MSAGTGPGTGPGTGTPPPPLLHGRRVVVAGATGGIGEGVARQLLAQGADVVALSRSRARLDELESRLPGAEGHLELLDLDVTTTPQGRAADRLRALRGGVDGVLVAIGTPGRPTSGTLLDIPEDAVRHMIEVNEIGALQALRTLVPLVRPSGAVIDVLGYSAEIPFPGNPLMGSTNAAVRSLLTTLAEQLRPSGPRVYALVVGVVSTRARRAQGIDDPRWLTGEQVGAYVADLVTGEVPRPDLPLRYLLDPSRGPRTSP